MIKTRIDDAEYDHLSYVVWQRLLYMAQSSELGGGCSRLYKPQRRGDPHSAATSEPRMTSTITTDNQLMLALDNIDGSGVTSGLLVIIEPDNCRF